MGLSMVIQLFHKFTLFNSKLGPTMNYFMVATTKFMEGDDEEGDTEVKLVPRRHDNKLVDEA
jgi:hypothetical protein